jgi:hypothetical protein
MRLDRSLVLCCALALAAASHGQSLDAESGPALYDQSLPQRPSTRGIFLGTIAALIAQGVGTGIGNAMSEGLAGSISRWFSGEPGARKERAQASAARPNPRVADALGDLQAGIAYEVEAIARDGTTRAVEPTRHAFRTGDRFQVVYRSTLPGQVKVFNIDPRGSETRVDAIEVAAGQLARLGPYQFVEGKGAETLRLVLEPCSSATLMATTRSIVKVAAGTESPDPALRVAECDATTSRGLRAKPRSIRKVSIDGTTVFALDALSADEINSGRVNAREIRITLQHR